MPFIRNTESRSHAFIPDPQITKRHDMGGLFEDFGTTLQPRSQNRRNQPPANDPILGDKHKKSDSQTTHPATVNTRGRSKTMASLDIHRRSGTIELSDSDSDDEMDLLSQKSSSHPKTFQKRLPDSNMPSTSNTSREEGCNGNVFRDVQGKEHQYDKNYPPKNRLTGLKFKKIKTASQGPRTSSQQLEPPSSPKRLIPSSFEDNLTRSKECQQSGMGDTVYVNHRKAQPRAKMPQKPNNIPSSSGTKFQSPTTNLPLKKSKPKPRPIGRATYSSSQINPTSSTTLETNPVQPPEPRPGIPTRPRPSSPKTTIKKPVFSVPTSPASPVTRSTEIKDFPCISPLREFNSDDGTRRLKRRVSPSRLPDPFPSLSPYNQRQEERDDHITRPKDKGKMKENEDDGLLTVSEDSSPRTMGSKRAKGKTKQTERLVVVGKRKEGKQKKPRKFPMSTQMLESIDSSPPDVASRRGKRSSDRDSDDEPVKKKSKKEQESHSQSLLLAFEDEGDSNPRTLCPYCDSRLPAQPSPFLVRLLATTKAKARPDPRPSNPLGLRAPMAVFVTVCQRHRFESEILPEAKQKGWPRTIKWNVVADRVIKMKSALQALIDDNGQENCDEDEWEVAHSHKKGKSKRKGPKASSVFWNDLMEEIKQKGTRTVAGVRGQFANFEKAQPGYYGEQGSAIINQTLYDLFPPSSIDANSIAPLTGNEFMQKILVPEVALRLIMEDRNLRGEEGRQEALIVLRESSAYGVFMFPEDDGEGTSTRKSKGDQLGVSDTIVMERAMKRRKELEEEEENERLMAVKRERMRATGKECETDKDEVEAVGQLGRTPRKPRPRPVGKASSAMSIVSSQDNPRSTRHRSRSRSRSIFDETDPASGIDTAIEISDSDSDSGIGVSQNRSRHAGQTWKPSLMRSTSRGLAGINLSSDGEPSSEAIGSGLLTRSRSRSNAQLKRHVGVKVTDEENMFIDATKTPTRYMDLEDNLDTPKAAQPSKTLDLPPLIRAQQRRMAQASVTSVKRLPRSLVSSSNDMPKAKSGNTKNSMLSLTNNTIPTAKPGENKKIPLPSRMNRSDNSFESSSHPLLKKSNPENSDFKWLLEDSQPESPELV